MTHIWVWFCSSTGLSLSFALDAFSHLQTQINLSLSLLAAAFLDLMKLSPLPASVLLSSLWVCLIQRVRRISGRERFDWACSLTYQAKVLSLNAVQTVSSISWVKSRLTFSFRLIALTSESSFSSSLAIFETMVVTLKASYLLEAESESKSLGLATPLISLLVLGPLGGWGLIHEFDLAFERSSILVAS